MSRIVRVSAAVTALVGVLVGVGSVPVSATGVDRVPGQVVAETVSGAHQVGDTVSVTVHGVTRWLPVTVEWGDGAVSTVTSSCSRTEGWRSPSVCGGTVTHTYTSTGGFVVFARQHERTVWMSGTAVAPVPTVVSAAGWEQELLALVNGERAKVGVAPLTLCAPLQSSAWGYAAVMVTTQRFQHVAADGGTPVDRAREAGYGGWVGENIAGG